MSEILLHCRLNLIMYFKKWMTGITGVIVNKFVTVTTCGVYLILSLNYYSLTTSYTLTYLMIAPANALAESNRMPIPSPDRKTWKIDVNRDKQKLMIIQVCLFVLNVP
jgi:hypothetical protein